MTERNESRRILGNLLENYAETLVNSYSEKKSRLHCTKVGTVNLNFRNISQNYKIKTRIFKS